MHASTSASVLLSKQASAGSLLTAYQDKVLAYRHSTTVTNKEKCGPSVLAVYSSHMLSLYRDGFLFYLEDLEQVVAPLAMQ